MRYTVDGSWRAATRKGGCLELETTVHVNSPEPADGIQRMLATAERACFTVQALIDSVPVTTEATLNGRPIEVPLA
jgi:hypothetical protein